jgi:hypothetical protein
MKRSETAKPATIHSEPALKIEQLGGPLNSKDSKTLADTQAESVFERSFVGRRFRTRAAR